MKNSNTTSNQLNIEPSDKDKFPSLITVVAKVIALILIVGMALYGVLQYVMNPGTSIKGLVVEHMSHVFFLMILIYLTLYLFFMKTIIAPIRSFQEKLYAISGGDLLPLSHSYRIQEIHDIAEGINLMIERISVESPENSLSGMSAHASTLREIAKSSETLTNTQKEELLDAANEMSQLAAESTKNVIHENEHKRKCRV
jgi:methyl-accepting chemotaxis protein